MGDADQEHAAIGTLVSDHLGPFHHPPRAQERGDCVVEPGGAGEIAGAETGDGEHAVILVLRCGDYGLRR